MFEYNPILQSISIENSRSFDILRLDLIHKEVSGNKWFKLKHNLEKANREKFKTVITFGGAFSNHIAATAFACKLSGFNSIAIIRGEEPPRLNSTLLKAQENGMVLHFVSREFYKQKNELVFKEYLLNKFGEHYLIPEGGNNVEGVLGCTEILNTNLDYDFVFCACGTATTFTGLVLNADSRQKTIGISVLKGENTLPSYANEILNSLSMDSLISIKGNDELNKKEIEANCITNNYCFNGYAKYDSALVKFKTDFESKYGIPLDYVYTSKLFYAVFDIIQKNQIRPESKILVIHCGGLQGNEGFENRYHLMPSL